MLDDFDTQVITDFYINITFTQTQKQTDRVVFNIEYRK